MGVRIFVASFTQRVNIMSKEKVIIRSDQSGVHFGTLEDVQHTAGGTVVELSKSRRIHYWAGAASMSQVAIEGIHSGRVAMELPKIVVTGVCEIIPVAETAISNLENQPVWKV